MRPIERRLPIGAEPQREGGVHFRVWSPEQSKVSVVVQRDGGVVAERRLDADRCGHLSGVIEEAQVGDRYWLSIDGDRVPDPASRFQPDGPFGPSQVIDPEAFAWTDAEWRGVSLRGQVLYEMHC